MDGTLIYTDMLHESAVRLLRDHPLAALGLPALLTRDKAALKQQLAARTTFDPETLPYNKALLAWLESQRAEGRRLVLCTASNRSIAAHLGIFDEVIASDGRSNVAGENKARILVERFGREGFDYAGNSSHDLPVWACARCAIIVNGSRRLVSQADGVCTVTRNYEIGRASCRERV